MSSLLKKKHLLAAKFNGGTLTYQQKVIADGANHYWRLSETSGVFIDQIGALNGTLSGTIQRGVPGAVSGNTAVRFIDQASAGKITLPSIPLTIPFSIECWIKVGTIPIGAGSFIFTNRTAGQSANVMLLVIPVGRVQFGPNTAVMDSLAGVTDNIWHHVVATSNGSQSTIFIDGVQDTQLAKTILNTNDVGSIGWDNFASFAIDLSVDELALYPLILTSAQVSAHYALRASVVSDPFFSSVSLLIGAETGVIDESSFVRTLTPIGNATRTTAQAKYGSASITFDGTGDGISIADSVDFTFGSGNFTVELFVRFVTRVSQDIIGHWEINGSAIVLSSWFLFHDNASTLTFRGCQGSTTIDLNGTWTPTLGQWYHIAIDRSGNTLRLYVDGVVIGTNSSFTATLNDCSSLFTLGMIGSGNPFPTSNFNGQMDEIRITKGVARYAGAFTPPTGPFPRS